jgi:hypothetical protein
MGGKKTGFEVHWYFLNGSIGEIPAHKNFIQRAPNFFYFMKAYRHLAVVFKNK